MFWKWHRHDKDDSTEPREQLTLSVFALKVLKALNKAVLDAGMRIAAKNKHSAKKEN